MLNWLWSFTLTDMAATLVLRLREHAQIRLQLANLLYWAWKEYVSPETRLGFTVRIPQPMAELPYMLSAWHWKTEEMFQQAVSEEHFKVVTALPHQLTA
jgi:hypothetical protein